MRPRAPVRDAGPAVMGMPWLFQRSMIGLRLPSVMKHRSSEPVHRPCRSRGARERKRKETGKKVGGRKSHSEQWPEVVAEARRLRGAKGKAGRLSYREISARLKAAGYRNERDLPFTTHSRFEQ